MPRQAQLADGTILEFPDNTPDSVIDSTVKKHIAGSSSRPQGGGIARQLGLSLRNTVTGLTDIAGTVTNPLTYLASKATGQPYQSFSDAAGQALDMAGVPRPQTGSERVVSDLGRSLSGTAATLGTGALVGRAPGLLGSFGQMLSDSPLTQIASTGTGALAASGARESGASPGVQTVAGLAGGLTPAGIKSVGAAGLRGLVRGGEQGRQRFEQNVRDFRSLGTEPTVGQATGNMRTQGAESLLSGAPVSAGVMANAAEQQAGQIGAGLRAKADAFFPNASAERAGRAVERGVTDFAAKVKATRDALYRAADAAIPPGTPLDVSNTRTALARLTTPTPGASATTSAMVNPKIAELAQNIEADIAANGGRGLPYEAVKDVRSKIGEALSDFSLSTDKPTAQYKQLYAALSQDMERAAQQQGPAAVQAVKRANNYFKASADRLDTIQRVVDKAGGPEKVYAAVMSGTQDGGTTLRSVMQSLPPDGQKAVTAAVIKRMGLATKGNQNAAGDQFSASTFLTNWNSLSKEARRTLFDRYGPSFSKDMDRIASVAENIRTGSKVFQNPSGTANRGLAYTYAGSLGASLLTGQIPVLGSLLAAGGSTFGLAKLMTNPRFVSWLANTTKVPVGALPAQAATLSRIADEQQDPEMEALAEQLKQAGKPNNQQRR